jgi:hypothetical protein
MNARIKIQEIPWWKKVLYFFPLQLLIVHIKKNYILLFYWIILFGIVTGSIAEKYGVPYLFLLPEYRGEVGFISYLILGFSCGGFIMAFNISSYIMNGFRFPFLATIARPFNKYCYNNSIIPIAFVITYLLMLINYQLNDELLPINDVLINCIGFIAGIFIFIIIAFTYFLSTNKDLLKILGLKSEDEYKPRRIRAKAVKDIFHRNNKWYRNIDKFREWPVTTYLASPFKIKIARDCQHYDRRMLAHILSQNHLNAANFEIAVVVSLIVLGLIRENEYLMIPAGATIFLLFTMFLMISSAIYSWFLGWSNAVFIGIILILNFLSGYNIFKYNENVYGLNYNGKKAIYSLEELKKYNEDEQLHQQDYLAGIEVLNKWRLKNIKTSIQKQRKPKMVIICASGGGLRATMWTFYSLQYADSLLNGELLKNTHIMTGSSGGMIGLAYLRDLYHKKVLNESFNIYDEKYLDNISKDLLNPVAFSLATNDLFLRLQKFNDGKYTYTKDRAYAFERQLNINTENSFLKRLDDYAKDEKESIIPTMFFTPCIINDGRMLLVASQNMSFLCDNKPIKNIYNSPIPEYVEFRRFFSDQDAGNTRLSSLLRINATFPYIFPVATLPSNPALKIMDGGIRDNYGIKTALRYLYTYRNWINTNTSGVIIIQIRDKYKEFEVHENSKRGLINNLVTPLESFYINFDKIQNFNHDEIIQYASLWLECPLDIIDFQLKNDEETKISMSWHLTTKEKNEVKNAIHQPENRAALARLKQLFE